MSLRDLNWIVPNGHICNSISFVLTIHFNFLRSEMFSGAPDDNEAKVNGIKSLKLFIVLVEMKSKPRKTAWEMI
ncbi:CLUMA_CG012304, isoform A [Clunio marinus]|uniref:CLUMA_CG012304, isoform A n=1 Tax=Clunio marinus TaxID=568069 RepID=A0A1J1IJT3_9DIPT|nr:CLUMA_CG012304, isoform A [Clunio marinus]